MKNIILLKRHLDLQWRATECNLTVEKERFLYLLHHTSGPSTSGLETYCSFVWHLLVSHLQILRLLYGDTALVSWVLSSSWPSTGSVWTVIMLDFLQKKMNALRRRLVCTAHCPSQQATGQNVCIFFKHKNFFFLQFWSELKIGLYILS